MARALPCIKTCFESEEEALRALASIIKDAMLGNRVRVWHHETGVYQCYKCGWWHLTSRPENQQIIGEAS